jgi:hypothetical protein
MRTFEVSYEFRRDRSLRALSIGILTVSLIVALAYRLSGQGSNKERTSFAYQRVVPARVTTYRHEKTCVAFASFLTSGNFFEGLRTDNTATGRKFFKGQDEVKEFPPELTLEIQAMMLDCSKFPAEPLRRAAADPFMRSLTFKVNWKTGLQQKPVEEFSLQVYEPDQSSWAGNGSLDWTYDLTVHSTGVPLSESLITEIYSKSKFLTRLSAHL